jgi:hypothetical protein
MSEKSRHLSSFEYFEVLQREYLIAEIRRKIYPSIKDKNYYKKIMSYKRDKIEDLSNRNNLDSIFTSKETRDKYVQEIYPSVGLPNFELTEKDILFYYHPESDVRVEIDGLKKVGKIVSVDFELNMANVKFRGESSVRKCKIHQVTRIL